MGPSGNTDATPGSPWAQDFCLLSADLPFREALSSAGEVQVEHWVPGISRVEGNSKPTTRLSDKGVLSGPREGDPLAE